MDASLVRLQGEAPSDRLVMVEGSIGSTAEDIADNEEAVAAVVAAAVAGKHVPTMTHR
jgi:hypothetical protein